MIMALEEIMAPEGNTSIARVYWKSVNYLGRERGEANKQTIVHELQSYRVLKKILADKSAPT